MGQDIQPALPGADALARSIAEIRTKATEILTFVDTVRRAHGAHLLTFTLHRSEAAYRKIDVAPYLKAECEAVLSRVNRIPVQRVGGASEDTRCSLGDLAVALEAEIARVNSKIGEASEEVRNSRSVASAVLDAMPSWLRQRFDQKGELLRALQENARALTQQLAAMRSVDSASEAIARLQYLVEKLVLHVGASVQAEEERRQAEAAERAVAEESRAGAEAKRAAEARIVQNSARRDAEMRRLPEDITRDRSNPYDITYQNDK